MTKDEAQKLMFSHIGKGLRKDRIERELKAAEKALSEALAEWSRATTAAALMRMVDE